MSLRRRSTASTGQVLNRTHSAQHFRRRMSDPLPEDVAEPGHLASVFKYTLWEHLRRDLGWETTNNSPHAEWKTDTPRDDDDDDVFQFLQVPIKLEKMLFYCVLACLDSMLFMFTFFPLRVLAAAAAAVWSFIPGNSVIPFKFHRTQLYDLLRGGIMLITVWFLLQVHMSKVYHYIRGQTFMKLYVIFNMLDIVDKLLASVGQDVSRALLITTRRSPYHVVRVGVRSVMFLAYAMLHSLLYFIRLITLNAAINSTNNALLTMLVSNNFVELKGSVFKKFAPENLFQVSCSDVVERFELFTFLLLTAIQFGDNLHQFTEPAAYVIVCEFVVDWIKHSFITKFNGVASESYDDYMEIFSIDMTPRASNGNRLPRACLRSSQEIDETQLVVGRVGLGLFPLTCVVLRFTWVFLVPRIPLQTYADKSCFAVGLALVITSLTLVKMLVSMLLKLHASRFLDKRQREKESMPTPQRRKLGEQLNQLFHIHRYTLFKSRIPT